MLGNADHFLEIIEKSQKEQLLDEKSYIPISFEQNIDPIKRLVQYLDMMEYGVFLLFIYFMFKRLRASGAGGDMF